MELSQVKEQVLNSKNIAIYGAGRLGHAVATILKNLDITVETFVVSDKKWGGGWNIDESADVLKSKDFLVLISLGNQYFDVVRSKLESYGLYNYIFMTEDIVMSLRMDAIVYSLKKIGIDPELFNGVRMEHLLSPFIQPDRDSLAYNCTSIKEKMYELACCDSARYALKNMQSAKMFATRNELHSWLRNEFCSLEGLFLEFGVAEGETINFFADNRIKNKIYGFDCFEGLPEYWTYGYEQGIFAQAGIPIVRDNVELVVGMFEDTLPTFLETHTGNCAFLHIDCDLYSSAQCVFKYLADRVQPGTVVLFDEYFNYPGWELHEFKAFQEFVQLKSVQYEYIAFTEKNSQVAVKIIQMESKI